LTTAGDVFQAIKTLPAGGLREILGGGTPIILAPHPDDEVIGCGGLLATAARTGRSPVVVYVTDGSGSHPRSRTFPRDVLVSLRAQEARAAARILGLDPGRIHCMGIRDTEAPRSGPDFAAAVKGLIKIIAKYANPVIVAPWSHDPHGDHQSVSQMATCAGRILNVRHLSYLVWGWTLANDEELGPVEVAGWRFPVNGEQTRKARALRAYKSQTTNLIDDDPTGFHLDAGTLKKMLPDDEVFLVNS
jgi:LmbE family N-acetylglucosaminyl deacetylase